MGWFKFRDSDPAPTAAPVSLPMQVPYHKRMKESRETLHWFVKKHSNDISTGAYSEIRELEKTLENINSFIEIHKPTAADEHMIESVMNDYLPSAVTLFIKLPEHNKGPGSEGEKLLLQQCRTMARDLKDRNKELHDRAEKNLRTQAVFIEDRFNDPAT